MALSGDDNTDRDYQSGFNGTYEPADSFIVPTKLKVKGLVTSDVEPEDLSNKQDCPVQIQNTHSVVTNPEEVQMGVASPNEVHLEVTNSDVVQVGVASADEVQVRVASPNEVHLEVTNPDVVQVGVASADEVQVRVASPNEVQVGVASPDEVKAEDEETIGEKEGSDRIVMRDSHVDSSDSGDLAAEVQVKEEMCDATVTTTGIANTDYLPCVEDDPDAEENSSITTAHNTLVKSSTSNLNLVNAVTGYKENLEKSLSGNNRPTFIYQTGTGEPSPISPCTEALATHQDLDPTRYGPNGNLDNRCEICNKTFSQPYLLKVHFRIHSGYKPYICELCNKGFAQSSGLRSHKLTHTGEKPYKCDVCEKTFTASGSLSMHHRTHNGERPFSCEVCGRTFRYRSAMNKHMMIHTGDRPYTCDVCGKDFSRKGNLDTHRRIHTNVMPYQCDVCEKKFNQMSNLRTHQVTHTLIKPYKCDLCGSEFFTKFNMQRHIVIQHIKNNR